MKLKTILITAAIGIPVVVLVLLWIVISGSFNSSPTTRVETATNGGEVYYHESPASTSTGGDLGTATSTNDLIHVMSPTFGQLVQSPLVVEGEARGLWYFEGVFPVYLLDAHGIRMGEPVEARAIGDWTTTDFVPFRATLTFSNPVTTEGLLVFEKDNPSGLAANGAAFQVPVKFQ